MWWWKWKNWGGTIPAFYWGFKSISEGRQNASGEHSHLPFTPHISMGRRWKEAMLSQKRSYLSKTEESRCCRVGVKGGRQGGQELWYFQAGAEAPAPTSCRDSPAHQSPGRPSGTVHRGGQCQHKLHLGTGGAPHPLLLSRCSMPRGGAGVGGNTGGGRAVTPSLNKQWWSNLYVPQNVPGSGISWWPPPWSPHVGGNTCFPNKINKCVK